MTKATLSEKLLKSGYTRQLCLIVLLPFGKARRHYWEELLPGLAGVVGVVASPVVAGAAASPVVAGVAGADASGVVTVGVTLIVVVVVDGAGVPVETGLVPGVAPGVLVLVTGSVVAQAVRDRASAVPVTARAISFRFKVITFNISLICDGKMI